MGTGGEHNSRQRVGSIVHRHSQHLWASDMFGAFALAIFENVVLYMDTGVSEKHAASIFRVRMLCLTWCVWINAAETRAYSQFCQAESRQQIQSNAMVLIAYITLHRQTDSWVTKPITWKWREAGGGGGIGTRHTKHHNISEQSGETATSFQCECIPQGHNQVLPTRKVIEILNNANFLPQVRDS
jgi:hypothetical protein